jgi:two-component system OmpR family sensor kinase
MSKLPREKLQAGVLTDGVVRTAAGVDSLVPAADLEQTIAELREAVRVREEFIAFAAHELRNPLTPIQLCVSLIRAAEQNGDRTRLVLEVNRLEQLLDRFLRRAGVLLDVTQLIAGRLRLEPTECCLAGLIDGVVAGLTPLLTRSGSRLRLNIPRETAVRTDGLAFTQIFENLLSNAIKYGMGKPIEVSLELLDGVARLKVRDHGMGIGPSDQARIFEPFERAVKRGNQPGFGLGLWITRRLAEAMGGSITVSSEKGAGSMFTVTLPVNAHKTDE